MKRTERYETIADKIRAPTEAVAGQHPGHAGGEVDAETAADPTVVGPFIDYLMAEFAISDREGLSEVVSVTAAVAKGHLWAHPTDPHWQKLYKAIQRVIDLVQEDEHRPLLVQELGRVGTLFGERASECLDDLMETLAIVGRASGDGLRHRKRRTSLASQMLDVLARYWIYRLEREFTQSDAWPKGENGQKEPATPATQFAFAIIEYLVPGEGKNIRTIARDFIGKPPENPSEEPPEPLLVKLDTK